jgi:hypothetical protein
MGAAVAVGGAAILYKRKRDWDAAWEAIDDDFFYTPEE